MTIEQRNDGILILADSGVLIFEVAEHIVTGKTMDWLCTRYPIEPQQVFDVIDTTADLLSDWSECIVLKNVGDESFINLETVKVNNTMYFNLLSMGHAYHEDVSDFSDLYILGLEKVVYDIYTDLKAGQDGYEDSDLHLVIYDALLDAIGNVDPDQVLALLGDRTR